MSLVGNTLISTPVPGKTVSSMVIVLYIGRAIPKQSNPGPRFAVVAGTFTVIFITYLPFFFSYYTKNTKNGLFKLF